MGAKYFGAEVRRREDPRYLTGQGRYLDDLRLPGLLHVAFLRSPHAHARIVAVDTAPARSVPGVVAAFGLNRSQRRPIVCLPTSELAASPAETRYGIAGPSMLATVAASAEMVGSTVPSVVESPFVSIV